MPPPKLELPGLRSLEAKTPPIWILGGGGEHIYIYIYALHRCRNNGESNGRIMENGTEATIQALGLREYNPNDGESNGKEHGE